MVLKLVYALSSFAQKIAAGLCNSVYVKVTNMSPGICCDDESNSYNS